MQVQQTCPRVVLPVVNVLVRQLKAPLEKARVSALALTGGMLSCQADKQHPQLFEAFVSRANDVKVWPTWTVIVDAKGKCSKLLFLQ